MNSNPGTHNCTVGLGKGSTIGQLTGFHSEKASTSLGRKELQQPDAWPSCMSEATIRALFVQTAAFAQSGCRSTLKWGMFLGSRNINARGNLPLVPRIQHVA
jgi:hypothetical protein